VLAGPDEPGDPLRVTGTIRDAQGPVAGALVAVWHTRRDGRYGEDGVQSDNPRLFGYLRTGADGRFEFRTIRPAGYPGGGAQHIHVGVLADGHAALDGTIVFADDPVYDGKPPARAAKVEQHDGVAWVAQDFVLGR
jgi:protocatechuate 3,4-dioxygenase beta subunit